MGSFIQGIKPPDEKWKAMKKIWDACVEADVVIPKDVVGYFGLEEPNPQGVIVDIGSALIPLGEEHDGCMVDMTKLPPDVKWIWIESVS
ncbi:hypothetical protein D3C71_1714140 [compost metagenome]